MIESVLVIANKLLRNGYYNEAFVLYGQLSASDHWYKKFVDFNKNFCEQRFSSISRKQRGKVYQKILESGFFDFVYYQRNYKEILGNFWDPLEHYIEIGEGKNLNPSHSFSTKFYKEKYPDVSKAGINALYHYVRHGIFEDRQILSGDITKPNDAESTRKVIEDSGFFNTAWYQKKYGDRIDRDTVDYLEHYLTVGFLKGFDPSEKFSTLGYLGLYRDVQAAGVNPLLHYLKSGRAEGRKPKPSLKSAALGLERLTPPESGTPSLILQFDSQDNLIEPPDTQKLTVHVHLYYTEMLEEILAYLKNITCKYTLLVSVCEDVSIEKIKEVIDKQIKSLNKLIVRRVPNRGRDVAPWVINFRDEIAQSDLFLHVHSKKSLHNPNHTGWFPYSMHTLLGSRNVVNQILYKFAKEQAAGIIAPCYYWALNNQPNYGKNKEITGKIFKRITKKNLPNVCPDYPAGSFFWCRTKILTPLFDLDLRLEDFDEENGQLDNTVAHGIERILGFLPAVSNSKYLKVAVDIAYDMVNYVSINRSNVFASRARYKPKLLTKKPSVDSIPTYSVYRSITGAYEELAPLSEKQDFTNYLVVGDSKSVFSDKNFKFVRSPYEDSLNPVRTARFIKVHPHLWSPNSVYAVWIDANIYFCGDIENYVLKMIDDSADVGVIFHPSRASFIQEAAELIETSKLDERDVNQQISRYGGVKDIFRLPLIETNFMIFNLRSEKTKRFLSLWWSEINNFTHRDQLSVNYSLALAGANVTSLLPAGYSVRNHPDFLIFEHSVKNRGDFIKMYETE